jgi:hypothetical protein
VNALAICLALVIVIGTVAVLHIVFESHELRPQELSAWN